MSLDNKVRVLSWNIKNAGKSKSLDDDAMDTIFKMLTSRTILGYEPYDLILLQEVENEEFLNVLDDKFKEHDLPYEINYKESGKIGTGFREHYVFIHNTETIKSIDVQLFPDKNYKKFKRPPVGAYVRSKNGFKGVFLNIHTSPDHAEKESRHMEYAVRWAKKEWHKNNVIIMGDMNKSSPYFGPKNKTPFSMKKPMEYPGNEIDTTINRRLKALDHVIWDSEYADLYSARVLKFDVDFWRRPFGEIGRDAVDGNGLYSVKAFQKVGKAVGNKLYYDSMRDISDHWPIEAVFYAEPSSKFRFKKVVNKFRDEWGDFRKVKYFPVK